MVGSVNEAAAPFTLSHRNNPSCAMIRPVLVLLLLLQAFGLRASHIIGGEIFYDYLGGIQYRVTLKLYRDCTPGTTGYDSEAIIGVFTGAGATVNQLYIPYTGSSVLPTVVDNPCLVPPDNVCVEVAEFSRVIELPPDPTGYVFTYQRCCRSPILSNIISPADVGITCTVSVPPQGNEQNSSPRFVHVPPIALCLGEPASFPHAASDADGDSLVYDLTTPYMGGSAFNPMPIPTAPPYGLVNWQPPYSQSYPIASDPAMAIHPQTGVLSVNPTTMGIFTVAVRVREYRQGVLLSEVRRDLCFAVVPCHPVTADIVVQEQTQFCAGLGVQFGNDGAGSAQWQWDFGVPGATTDTSTAFRPYWEYPSPGTYTVTLISNPGLFCSDTAQAQFAMYHAPVPLLELPPPTCGAAELTLEAAGTYYPEANIFWSLGNGATPSTATGPSVTALFSASGAHAIALTVEQQGCSATVHGTLFQYPVPTAHFTVTPPPGSGVTMGDTLEFFDMSTANGADITGVQWLVDGDLPPWSGGALVWENVPPGMHAVDLTLFTVDGCESNYTLSYFVEPDTIIVPNVFTPNGDGKNDRFVVPYLQYLPNHLQIFDRWGGEVYAAFNYSNSWAANGISDGTYYYVLRIRESDVRTGTLTILR